MGCQTFSSKRPGSCERPDHPGYYWLVYSWDNLYPSCKFCNQRRKDNPRFNDPRTLPPQGKLDQFPIEDENNRAMKPDDDLSKERPLLLDPCKDEPETHFTYDILGQIYAIESNDRFAEETIQICHLQRRRLCKSRVHIVLQVYNLLKVIEMAREVGNKETEKALKNMLNDDFLSDSSIHAGVARAIVRQGEDIHL